MRSFWQQDFLGYGNADLSPPQHKLSRLLASGNVSYMLSQPENRIDFREVMDTGKILVVNLANIGSETREVLGCFMLSLLRLAAISRSDIPPPAQMRFHVYCDEAHRFITDAIEDLIEETRKYNVSLALAHQYMSQFSTRKSDAISGVGTTIMFRVNTVDATFLRKDLQGKVDVDALTNLAKYEAIARIGTEVVKLKTRKAPPLPANDPRGLIIERSRQLYYRRLWDLNPGPRVRECHAPLNFDPSGAADDAVDESPEMYAYQEL